MDVRAFGSWMSAPKCLSFQDLAGLTEVFARGRPPGYPRGCPRDIRPQTYSVGCCFVPDQRAIPAGPTPSGPDPLRKFPPGSDLDPILA